MVRVRNRDAWNPELRSGKLAALGCGMAALIAIASADNPAATVSVNAGANRHAISPLIYGANWADQATVSDLNLSLNRRGGNARHHERQDDMPERL